MAKIRNRQSKKGISKRIMVTFQQSTWNIVEKKLEAIRQERLSDETITLAEMVKRLLVDWL